MAAVLAAAALAACAATPERAGGPQGAEARAREVMMPGPARARGAQAALANRACEGCHEEVAIAWRASLHRRADVEPAYRRAFAIEPLPFCRSCHAPEADPTRAEGEEVAALGVGCVTCHLDEGGAVLAAPRVGEEARAAPHAVVRDARFAGVEACASCHEFAFPGARGRTRGELMQATVAEHRDSPAAARSCADCHMPRDHEGRRDHAFRASRDPDFVRRAAAITAVRTSPTAVRVTLTPRDPGHAFPTGDLFRRLEISAEAAGPDEMVLGRATRYLTRHWARDGRHVGRRLAHDDRPTAAPVVIDLDVGAAGAGHAIVWRAAYQRVAHPNGIDDEGAVIDGEIPLASGRIEP